MKVFIWGTGNLAKHIFEKINNNYDEIEVLGFIDNDKMKWGKEFCSKKIYEPNILSDRRNTDVNIIIASMYYFDIVEQLIKLGNYQYQCASELISLRNSNVLSEINEAKILLYRKLEKLNIMDLKISDYNKRYLLDMKKDRWNILNRYGELLLKSLEELNWNKKVRFLDYGGGTGILSLLACELGITNVYYNDIYDVSVQDSKVIAEDLGYTRKGYISGDINEILNYCKGNNLKFNLISSYDVLEHIYSLEAFFDDIVKIMDDDRYIMMCTSANPYNDNKVKQYIKHHYELEYNDRNKEYGYKERDSNNAYYNIRKKIIKEFFVNNNVNFEEETINDIALLTRGKIKEDIIKFLEKFLENNSVEHEIDRFISNTCDPITGNWAEHLINFPKLIKYITNIESVNEATLLPEHGREISQIISLNLK